MLKYCRGKLVGTLGWSAVFCILTVGCQFQVAYSIMGGPKNSPASTTGTATDSRTSTAAGSKEVVRAGYATQEPPRTSVSAYSQKQDNSIQLTGGSSVAAREDVTPDKPSVFAKISVLPNSNLSNAKSASGLKLVKADKEVIPVLPDPKKTLPDRYRDPVSGPVPLDYEVLERPIPTELAPVVHPPYMIEPPDILLIDAVRMIPKPPYVVQPLDVLMVRVSNALPNQPIEGAFIVGPDGTVNLGFNYGVVRVAGMSLERAQNEIRRQLSRLLQSPQVAVGLGQFRGIQQLRGEHLVRQDGTISLGTYGCVMLSGLTIPQAKCKIEQHLSHFLVNPEISLDIRAYNSKVFYIITDGAGYGQQVYRFPITGKETVLDAISQIQGLPAVASTRNIWVARPAPAHNPCVQVLPVDWNAITQGGSTATNYQLFPGDRIFVKADPLIRLDYALAKIISPIERVLGVTLLGSATANSLKNSSTSNGVPLIVR